MKFGAKHGFEIPKVPKTLPTFYPSADRIVIATRCLGAKAAGPKILSGRN
jgi:hypothetical protein